LESFYKKIPLLFSSAYAKQAKKYPIRYHYECFVFSGVQCTPTQSEPFLFTVSLLV
jgi:hypothetical protein